EIRKRGLDLAAVQLVVRDTVNIGLAGVMRTASRGAINTFSCSAVISSTVTFVLGSSLPSVLSNWVVISPTLRVPKSSIVEGLAATELLQTRPGSPSHFTSIF